ncbi:DUF551 domain-containing protein [Citrobacter meridianamericanus]|uniref:DUF551 domain-containing protein n=1 Tax=Citrobacter meridianamericanus TaxID=2894201 RepID=A0ABT1B545_9ENTR|nr:DUF551 domain-containing protein [Citrobacter meridianamericanus]MCO5780626.1 DUF551 domain-containing protein [Citrobacter meridianamericanus]
MNKPELTDEKIKRRINAIEDRRSASRDFWDGDYEYPEDIELLALRELQERRKADSAEPIGWTDAEELRSVEKDGCGYLFKANPISPNADPRRVIKLYRHAQPAPVMNDELYKLANHVASSKNGLPEEWQDWAEELESEIRRAAMLQAGNSPVTPDGWINCRERLPKPNKYVLVCNGVWVGVGMYNNAEHFEDDERWQDEHGEFIDLLHHPVTHWQSLPAAPKQENV